MPSIGDPDRAPLAPGGGLAYMTGALNAAMGTMLALTARGDTGSGGQLVDVSLQEAVLSVTMEVSPHGGARRWLRPGAHAGSVDAAGPIGHYATQDGAVSIVAYMPEHWRTLAEWIRDETGVEEITSDGVRAARRCRAHPLRRARSTSGSKG